MLYVTFGPGISSSPISAGLTTSNFSSYRLRKEQSERLQPGKRYLWQVQALDSAGKIVAETGLRSFQFAAAN